MVWLLYGQCLQKIYLERINRNIFRGCNPVEDIVFIDFVVFKDQQIAIGGYLYMPCVDQVY